MSEHLRTGQVTEAAGVNVQTLRYYERRSLLPEPDRSLGGHRLYDGRAVTVLRVILATIREALVVAVDAGCDDLTVCAGSDSCPIPFTDLAEESRHAGPCC